ncbi:TPA: hypothetical protein QH394_002097 [Klebsiella aerogenes]|nr:hypothetical protein [Klebsiella aerogenes]
MSIYKHWGKTRRGDAGGGDDYHLLCWHGCGKFARSFQQLYTNDNLAAAVEGAVSAH